MIHRTVLQLLIISCFRCALSQSGNISGVVSGDQPLEFATVGLVGTKYGTVTNTKGFYELRNIPPGDYRLMVSSIGYTPKKHEVTIAKATTRLEINIRLEESVSKLEEVMVVSGTLKEVNRLESAVPVDVYTPAFFKANPTPSVFESMQNVNGVRPQLNCNVCNTGDIHINGLEGPYTMVTIDGMPIVSGLSTVYGLTGIPQSLIAQVEVVKGPASTLYGSEAVGGLINIITRKPENASMVAMDVFGTTWGELNSDLSVRLKAGEKAHVLVGVNYFYYQNPIDHNDDGFTDVTLQDRISVFNKWTFDRENDRIFSVAARYVYEDRWGGEMDWTPEHRGGTLIYGESIYTSRWELLGTYQLPVQEVMHFQLSTNGHNQNSVYGNSRYLADQYIAFGQLTWNKQFGRHDLLSGAAFRYTWYDDNTPATAVFDTLKTPGNQPAVTYLPGLFLQDEIQFDDRNKMLVGLRYDYNSLHGAIFSPRINYKWNTLDQKHIIRMSIGNGYRVANVFTEDHAALTGARQVEFEDELQPETSWNANLNVVKKIYTTDEVVIDLNAGLFYTYFNNRIIPDYESDPNKIIYSNLDGFSASRGISVNADISWPKGLSILTGFTFQDVFIRENGIRTRQLLTERVSGVWNIGFPWHAHGLSFDYTGNLYGPMRLPLLGPLDDRPEYSPWWSIQNIQVTKNFWNGVEIYGGVKNLLNYTPPANSIARAFDPFDKNVEFNSDGQVIPTADNPQALTFDPTYVFAPNQGIRGFLGVRYTIK